MKRYIIGLDEGTTSARTVVYDTIKHEVVCTKQQSFKQYYPKSSWVEQNPEDIWTAQKTTLDQALKTINPTEVIGIGITNQRETVIAWNKETGNPIYNAIVWQCRRTSKAVEQISDSMCRQIKDKTGLIPNAYFSATKMKWLLDNVPEARTLAEQNKLCMGTVDSFLAYKLTGKFVTDTSNASRTMLFNIKTLTWDSSLLEYFNIPISCLPEVVDSNQDVGMCLDYPFPLCGIIGDQQSSLVGQACLKPGMAKATYGTGCFVLMNIGNELIKSNKMLCTVAYTINGKTTYALEGSVYSACNAIDWLQNNLCLFNDVKETHDMCTAVESTDGVYLVPAFTGLGAPYWTDDTKGTIVGMTLSTNKNHIVRACFESIAYNTYAVIKEMSKKDISIKELHVDGGGSKNPFLLQFQADLLQENIVKSKISECTAMGAIYMVALNKKVYTLSEIQKAHQVEQTYSPIKSPIESSKLIRGWNKAVLTTMYHG